MKNSLKVNKSVSPGTAAEKREDQFIPPPELICINCGNFTYFESEARSIKEITVTPNGLVIQNATWDDCDYSQEDLLTTLFENIDYALEDHVTSHSIACARCGSDKVTIPFCKWKPPSPYQSLDEEMVANHKEYQQLRKERRSHEDQLLLRKLDKVPDSPVGSGHLPF